MHALWKVRFSVVWFHLQQFVAQAHASMPVDLPAFNILDSCHKNRSSHPSPQSLPKSKPPPKWARDSFFHHSGSSPLSSTCRHVRVSAVDVHVVLIGFSFQLAKQFTRQASSLCRRVAPVRGDCCVRALSILGWSPEHQPGPRDPRRTNPWSTSSEARVDHYASLCVVASCRRITWNALKHSLTHSFCLFPRSSSRLKVASGPEMCR